VTEGKLLTLCRTDEVSEDEPLAVEIDGFTYAVFTEGGEYFVTADQCTHGPGSLAEGGVIGGEIECPFHQGRFDLRTGQPSAPPCTEAIRVWTVHVVDGDIRIDPDETRR
jgi:ethylbenzene dioxygenase ferredoxin component